MKSSFGFACLIGLGLASQDVGQWSYSTEASLTLYDQAGMKWVLKSMSVFDWDNGLEYFRITHELDALIKPTDEVSFELSYGSASDPWTNKQVIAEDSVMCKMTRNTQNTKLWTQTASDSYYSCSDILCLGKAVGGIGELVKNTDTNSTSDWTVPLEDDDEEAPYCTANSDDANDTFACKKIKCTMQRLMDTGDIHDFAFTPTGSAADAMLIRPGRAFVGINETGCSSCSYV